MFGKTENSGMRIVTKGTLAASLASLLMAAMAVAPKTSAAAKSAEENRLVKSLAVDRAEIENLQRWVAAGHEDWCKDARLVAAEELKRLAVDFAEGATQLNAAIGDGATGGDGAKKAAFEWTPLDGRATYRVTVERFEWLLPMAKDANAVVWVPTKTEIQIHE